MNKSLRVIITGGHHTSALVVANALRKEGHKIFWFGHKYTMWAVKNKSIEYQEVKKFNYPFFDIKATKARFMPFWTQVFLSPFSFIQCFLYLLKIRPNIIVSFGGYLAIPVVITGWFLGIPAITHEQTVAAGLANRILKIFVKKILITWSSSFKFFPTKKTIIVGLPLRNEIFQKKSKFFKNHLPTIFVTGGKQGSHIINKTIGKILSKILKKANLIHQTGETSFTHDLERLKKLRQKLPEKLKGRYLPKSYFFKKDIGRVFATSDLVIGRSGAHITYELIALGKPALLIPFPKSIGEEQKKNAFKLANLGMAEIIFQKTLTPQKLYRKVNAMLGNQDYKKNARKAKRLVKKEATKVIVKIIEENA